MAIKSLKELQEAWKISRGDIIYFYDIEYMVTHSHLSNSNGINGLIFKHLWIENKHKFCSDLYWYKTIEWDFPIYRGNDMEALYRVAIKIYELIENMDYSEIDVF